MAKHKDIQGVSQQNTTSPQKGVKREEKDLDRIKKVAQ